MIICQTEIRVRYADTDQMQFVYNGKYLEYFEVGRTEMMREQGLTYRTIEENGYQMPVHEAFLKFKNPAFYDELLEVETRVEKLPLATPVLPDHRPDTTGRKGHRLWRDRECGRQG